LAAQADEYLAQLRTKVEEQKIFSRDSILKSMIATGAIATRDPQVNVRIQSAPHQGVLATIWAIRSAFDACNELSKVADRAARHIDRMSSPQTRVTQQVGTNVFIGHGRSLLWHQLKDFIQDRLQLPVDEFNRVPIAGITNIDRLSRMLDEAAVAFLVLTAEDERVDGTMTARLNVVHEVGLFQGRLEFGRAIVMVEEDCEGFTNIEGLGQIRFPAGNIAASFENVRQLVERERLIGGIE
jgi:predicted nucleotide-binding protein